MSTKTERQLFEDATYNEDRMTAWEVWQVARATPTTAPPIAYSLQWPSDVDLGQINISTTFDTEKEAREYADGCLLAEVIKVVPLYLGPVDMQGARDEH